MNYLLYSLLGAIFLSISDVASKYALDNKISNLTYVTWSHGVLYVVLLTIFIILCLILIIDDASVKMLYQNIY